jgi:hypothetical protein
MAENLNDDDLIDDLDELLGLDDDEPTPPAKAVKEEATVAEAASDDLDIDDLLSLEDDEEAAVQEVALEPVAEKPAPKKRAPRVKKTEVVPPAVAEATPPTEKINPTVEDKIAVVENKISANAVTEASVRDGVITTASVTSPTETADQKRIRELEAQLAAATHEIPVEPEPEPLTADQLRIIELETMLAAQKEANEADVVPVVYSPAPKGETILLHFVEDGFNACGQIWYRGQELEFEVGGAAHKQQINSKGKSWLDLVDDIDGQFDRWGKQYFAAGPWRGRSWADAPVPEDITDPKEIAEYKAGIKVAEANERKRNRAAPILRG